MAKVQVIECFKCGDRVYSRTRHDFRSCECGAVAIDGGFSGYTKLSGNPGEFEFLGELEIPQTQQELYDDWNKQKDKFGKL
jgi:hypothetical protein